MAITIPDRTQIRIVTDFQSPQNGRSLPNVLAQVALTNPGPVVLHSATASNGQAQVKQAGGGNGTNGYVGFNPKPNVGAGQPLSPVRGVIVDGFSGVTVGSDVFIDQSNTADASGTASGLTQTQPTQTVTITNPGESETATVPGGKRIGVGWTATKVLFD
jgi:hypothetical protein